MPSKGNLMSILKLLTMGRLKFQRNRVASMSALSLLTISAGVHVTLTSLPAWALRDWRTLEIEFDSGDIYEYLEVPEEEYIAFRAAGSKGTYLNQAFKPRDYRYIRIQ